MTIDKQDITEEKDVSTLTAKRKIKDSVFTDLFDDKKYLIQLYKADVLKEYLETKKQEVIDIMMLMFDQETVLDIHVKSEKKEAAIRAAIEAYKIIGKSYDEVIKLIMRQFKLSEAQSSEWVNEVWNDIEEETL